VAIDIRARVTCNLGDVISASISDDYIQGTGLIKSSGSCQIKGIITPKVGDIVVFQYTKSGITRRIPRTMRVLSSFADPFRKVTSIELGCKLTYLQDLKDPIKLSPRDDEENSGLTNKDAEIITFPTYASSVMDKCLLALGLPATSIPLTNKFSVAEFDLSSGYVDVLSNLLVSESYCGYLDEAERLVVIDLATSGGTGPLVTSGDLIDIGPIGVGQLAGDAVFVSYSTLKLRPPEDEAIVCRELTPEEEEEEEEEEEDREPEYQSVDVDSEVSRSAVVISYTAEDGNQKTQVFPFLQSSYSETLYRAKEFKDPETGEVVKKAVVIQRKTYEASSAAAQAGGLVTQYLDNGIGFNDFKTTTTTLEKFDYDVYGNEIYRKLSKKGPAILALGLVGLPMVYPQPDGGVAYIQPPAYEVLLEEIVVRTYTNGNFKRSTTKRYGPWAATISGQQSIAESRESFTFVAQVEEYIADAIRGRYLIDVTISTERRSGGDQEAPLPEEQINEELAEDTGDPNNGFRTESVSETEVVTGSPLSQRRIELSMPYAPDDTFRKVKVSDDPIRYCYYASRSDAPAKAARYGRAQNRMLLGNRSGMNIQIVPEKLPSAPFAPLYIEAAGTIALYRVNAASWTMDANGIVASTDAMFWGTAGRTS
jgi:hypothetical protein